MTNLVLGLCLAALGFGFGLAPVRIYRLAWTCLPIAVFAIIAPWVVPLSHTATKPMIWSNAFSGGALCLFGLMESGTVIASMRSRSQSLRRIAETTS